MQPAFTSRKHLETLGKALVLGFEAAGASGHGPSIGGAREDAARAKLQAILPSGIGVGVGFVIDSYGGVSQQQDIILYEKAFCPVFSSGGDETFFPIEGVVAVGEVKSRLTQKELADGFKKVSSAKKLRRRSAAVQPSVEFPELPPFRHYCDASSFTSSPGEGYSQADRPSDQIFGFVLCQHFATKGQTLVRHACELAAAQAKHLAPDLITSVSDGFICPVSEGDITSSSMYADELLFCDENLTGFVQLIVWLRRICVLGRTVPLEEYDHYFRDASMRFRCSARASIVRAEAAN